MAQTFQFTPANLQTTIDTIDLTELRAYLHAPGRWLIADEILLQYFPQLFQDLDSACILYLAAGESNKTHRQLLMVYQWMLKTGAQRSSEFVVLGGGTITDLAAYAVATFMRGCKLTLVPTTLIGMVDAAIGGKTGLNLEGYKNLVGCFYPAHRVFIALEFLESLPMAERRQGWAEIIKLYLMSPLLTWEQIPEDLTPPQDLVMQCVARKLELCIGDLEDRLERRWLNLGHSFGHALETASGYQIPHGDAVLRGMLLALKLSVQKGLIDDSIAVEIADTLHLLELPELDISGYISSLADIMQHDKKNSDTINLVLFTGWRTVEVIAVSLAEIKSCL